MQLPTDLENLVGYFAYGGAHYELGRELNFLIACRGLIPELFLSHCVYYGTKPITERQHDYEYVNNPLIKSNAFYPWVLVNSCTEVFNNSFIFWALSLTPKAFRALHTYPRCFMKHIRLCGLSGKYFSDDWNYIVEKYLINSALLNLDSYQFQGHEHFFNHICVQLENVGFTPAFSHRSELSSMHA